MIVITGAAGFIGSCLVSKLNKLGHKDLILVDDFSKSIKNKNLENKSFHSIIERKDFFEWNKHNYKSIEYIFHIGARTDTTESNNIIFNELNLEYSKRLWRICIKHQIHFIYASSAATYGAGEFGFDDNLDIIKNLTPLNPYAISKNDFDKWVLLQNEYPPFWVGLKFFNVYGPNEYHKGRMASVILHAYQQISNTGRMKLFRSHKKGYKDGEQLRDFIYVQDVIEVLCFMLEVKSTNTIYNLGSGVPRSFNDLVKATFSSMNKTPNIEYIDIPEDIRETYQYFTKANMKKLINAGYKKPFRTLESGINDYVKRYLESGAYY